MTAPRSPLPGVLPTQERGSVPSQQPRADSRFIRVILLAMTLCAALSFGLVVFGPVGGSHRRTLCLLAESIAVFAAVAAILDASRRVGPRDQRAWRLMSAAMGVGAGGPIVATALRMDPVFSSLAVLAAAPLVAGAVVIFATLRPNMRGRSTAILELLMLAGATLVVLWVIVGWVSTPEPMMSSPMIGFVMIGPAVLLVAGGFCSMLLLSATSEARCSLTLLTIWIGLAAAASTANAVALAGGSVPHLMSRYLVMASALALAMAAMKPHVSSHIGLDSQRARVDRGFMTTFPMIVVGLAVAGDSFGVAGESVELVALLLVPAVVARLVITCRQSGELVDRLGDRVDLLRTREAQMRDARAAAVAAGSAQRSFLSRTSHELRTPLHAVMGFSELMALDPLTHQQAGHLEEIQRAGGYLLELVDDLLDLAQVEQGEARIDLCDVPALEVIQEAMKQVSPMAANHGAWFELRMCQQSHVVAHADRRRLRQVIVNLLTNAVKYAGGGILVQCDADADAESIRVHVVDSGPGIAPSEMSRLFAPFDRLGAEETGRTGAGLGLPVARSFARAMDGDLEVSSVPHVETRFTISLGLSTTAARSGPLPCGPDPQDRLQSLT